MKYTLKAGKIPTFSATHGKKAECATLKRG
jgi:hypothetical protein